MFDINKIKDYIPFATVFLGAFLAYIFGFRKAKLDKFNNLLEENLSQIISPMFHSSKKIMNLTNASNRQDHLVKFFEKYSSEESKIYKISNK